MANKKYDGVIEAVHYAPDGQVEWVRAYLRRGADLERPGDSQARRI